MKKPAVLLIGVLLLGVAHAQDTITVYKNEIGLDVLSLHTRLSEKNVWGYDKPLYFITYRHRFEGGNFRSAIGGDYVDEDNSDNTNGTIIIRNTSRMELNLRAGWEITTNPAKHWMVYAGTDLSAGFSFFRNEWPLSAYGYYITDKRKEQIYGVSPLLGIRARFTERFCVLAECNMRAYITVSKQTLAYVPSGSQYVFLPDAVQPVVYRAYAHFRQPLSVYLTFDF